MLIKTLILFILGVAAVGLGVPLLRILAPDKLRASSLPMGLCGLLGLFVAASAANVINFLAPVSLLIAVSLFAIGLALFLTTARSVWRSSWGWYAGLALIVTPIAVLSPEGYDGGLYHLPHQYWMVTDKIVFGLANLHSRFGFNSINEPLLALGWVFGKDLSVVPLIAGLFSLFFLLAIVEAMRDASDSPVLVYFTCVAGVGYLWIHGNVTRIGWTNTDIPTALTGLICIYCGLAAAIRDDRDFLVLSYFFAAFAAALKLSGAVVGLFPLGITIIWIARLGLSEVPWVRILLVSALFLPWIASNLVVSGCFMYPVSWTCLSVPWGASPAAENVAMWIKAWARAPATRLDHLSGWAWIPIWLERMRRFLISWAAVAVFGLVVTSVIARTRSTRPVPLAPIVVFATYATTASLFWFLAAPEPRFGIGHLLALGMLPGLLLLPAENQIANRRPIRWIPVALLAGSLFIAVGYSWIGGVKYEQSLLSYHTVHFGQVKTTMDGAIRRPVDDDRCFLTQPPCSPKGVILEGRLGSYRAYFALK